MQNEVTGTPPPPPSAAQEPTADSYMQTGLTETILSVLESVLAVF